MLIDVDVVGGLATPFSPVVGATDAGVVLLRESTGLANATTRRGGGILTEGPTVLEASAVRRNSAGITGGGIYAAEGADAALDESSSVTVDAPDDCAGALSC
jgi:hypothetical protein